MKKQLVFYIAMAAIVLLPMKSVAQSDSWFNSYSEGNRETTSINEVIGTGNQGFGQEPEAPLGSGLAILLATGAGYAIMKSKKSKKN